MQESSMGVLAACVQAEPRKRHTKLVCAAARLPLLHFLAAKTFLLAAQRQPEHDR